MTETRISGRRLQVLRADLFRRFPWCQDCTDAGRSTRSTVRDHVVPLQAGGTEDASNIRAVCLDCADARGRSEGARGVQPSLLQDPFRKSAMPRGERGRFIHRRRGGH